MKTLLKISTLMWMTPLSLMLISSTINLGWNFGWAWWLIFAIGVTMFVPLIMTVSVRTAEAFSNAKKLFNLYEVGFITFETDPGFITVTLWNKEGRQYDFRFSPNSGELYRSSESNVHDSIRDSGGYYLDRKVRIDDLSGSQIVFMSEIYKIILEDNE